MSASYLYSWKEKETEKTEDDSSIIGLNSSRRLTVMVALRMLQNLRKRQKTTD